ncbi:MAG: hypothetical protein ABIS25_11645, partial [Sphingomicrobium sp.]
MTLSGRLAISSAAAQSAASVAPEITVSGGSIGPDKRVVVPSFTLPPSIYISDAARHAMPAKPTDSEAQMRQMLAAGMIPSI